MNAQCFLMEKTDIVAVALRTYRFSNADESKCTGKYGYHNVIVPLGARPEAEVYNKIIREEDPEDFYYSMRDDFRAEMQKNVWPTHCDCGYEFVDAVSEGGTTKGNVKQIYARSMYKTKSGELYTLEDAPAGAVWKNWYSVSKMYWDNVQPWDDYIIKCPGGSDWMIGSRCNNCGSPQDKTHRCWVITGDDPEHLTSSKGPGPVGTCAAGAGSIQTPNWHGMLENGLLRQC